jgi:hypothetical protein
MLRQKAAVAATGIEAKLCNSLLKMEQIVSAAAVKQKFVRVFCVPTQITANHAPSIREPTRGRRQLHTRRSNCTVFQRGGVADAANQIKWEGGEGLARQDMLLCVSGCAGRTGLRWS